MSKGPGQHLRILCLACTPERLLVLQTALKNSRYSALTASTSEQAVALCVAHVVVAAVVDAKSVRGQEWPVMKSLKGVRYNLLIILLGEERISRESEALPEGVDAVVDISNPKELYEKIDELVRKAESAA